MFTRGFEKIAKYDEAAEYEKANKVDRQLIPLASPTQQEPAKEGARVAYYCDDRGWKRGPWGSHTKGCSHDEEMDKPKKALEKKLKKAKVDPAKISDIVRKEFPMHHSGDWNKHAVKHGELGTIHKVDKEGFQTTYHVVWDKHPDCAWPGYRHHELKLAPEGL